MFIQKQKSLKKNFYFLPRNRNLWKISCIHLIQKLKKKLPSRSVWHTLYVKKLYFHKTEIFTHFLKKS